MTDPDHDRYRDLTAAYVLGALDADERGDLDDHLRTCERCRQDVVAFAPLPALLGRVEGADAVAGAPEPDGTGVVAAVRSDIATLDRSRRRWRWAAGAAAAVAAVIFAFLIVDDDTRQPPRSAGIELAVVTADSAGSATVTASQHAWGTYVRVSAERLPERDSYALWVVDEAGDWEPAGTFARTSDGAADLGGSSQLQLAQIDRIVVTSTDRTDEILIAR